ncbi:MAG: 50S ribosomal protein L13 [Candidatus Micrarchaeota archaeon]|nr:50S ribosomal protein L13 [Candidatus Micrarchaeota archaeon]
MTDYVIDGKEQVLGRAASQVAKLLLQGNNVIILNSESMLITGHKRNIVEKYKRLVELKDKANPEHSPYWSRRPDLFVKRIVRGMLPYKKPRGKEAFKKLRVYISVPESFQGAKAHKIESKKVNEIYENVISVKELTANLGYKGA